MTREFALWCAYSAMLDALAPVANAAEDAAQRAVTAGATTADREFTRTVADRLEAERERVLIAMRRFAPIRSSRHPRRPHGPPKRHSGGGADAQAST
ncbi:hypothetical protein [Falsiroseomonas sp. E2-1-a20]|uniref:hypothetical protein n=1 Tax=Falsiroseomonas sp. E2-1-a20 TaxID=3239300 RepID=UPI003F2D61CA